MSRMTLMATTAMQKQASVAGAIDTGKNVAKLVDRVARGIGRFLGAGKSQAAKTIHQKAAFRNLNNSTLGKAYSTDAAELLRLKRLQKADELVAKGEAGVAAAERLAGYGAAGAGILGTTAGGIALTSGKKEKPVTSEKKEEIAKPATESNAVANERKPEQPKSNSLRDSLLIGGATAAGATAGGLIDRRNRLRGILVGGLIAGGATGLGLALSGRK